MIWPDSDVYCSCLMLLLVFIRIEQQTPIIFPWTSCLVSAAQQRHAWSQVHNCFQVGRAAEAGRSACMPVDCCRWTFHPTHHRIQSPKPAAMVKPGSRRLSWGVVGRAWRRGTCAATAARFCYSIRSWGHVLLTLQRIVWPQKHHTFRNGNTVLPHPE